MCPGRNSMVLKQTQFRKNALRKILIANKQYPMLMIRKLITCFWLILSRNYPSVYHLKWKKNILVC